MHPIVLALSTAWGLAAGAAVARAPWQAWIGPSPEDAVDDPAAGRVAGGAPAAGPGRSRWWLPPLGAAVCAALARLTGDHPELAVWLLLVPVGLLLARIDLAVRRLPDVLTVPAAAGAAVLLGAAALSPAHQGSWPRALLGAVALLAAYFVLMLVNPAGMGFGDVKLAPTLGLVLGWYGWRFVFYGTFLAFALGALVSVALLATRRATRKTALPFGPFMLLGALGGLLLAGM